MNRRVWSSALAIAFVAGLTGLLVYFAADLANGLAMRDLALDANMRSEIAREILRASQSAALKHQTRQQTANEIVAMVGSVRGYDAAVVGDDGTLLAGNRALAAANPLPPMPPIGLGPGFAAPSAPRLPGDQFGPRTMPNGPWSFQLFAVQRPGSGPGGVDPSRSPASLVRIDGATVIIARSVPLADAIARWRWLGIGAIAISFCLALLVSHRLLRSAMRPFEFVRSALTRLGGGDYSRLSVADPEDGVTRELVDAYNAAAGEVASTVAQRQEVEDNIRRFVADAGHELRTPLAVITGYVELLRHGSSDENVLERRIFSEIDGQGQRMRALIQNLLFLLRLDSQEPSDVKILDASDVVRGVVDSFQSLANGATLSVELDPGAFVQISETELNQAIGNLIDNALKYAPASHILARVKKDGVEVVIVVSDDGPGMNPDTRARAFERFSRGETSGSIPGSGRGLAIVARTAERAGGSVSLRTEANKGTTIELRFPAWQPQ